MKRTFYFLAFFFGVLAFSSCIDEDDGIEPGEFPDVDKGEITVNRMVISFLSISDSSVSSFEYYDADGFNSGNPPTVEEVIRLRAGNSGVQSYFSSVQFFQDDTEVTADIKSLGTKYIVCYRDWNTNFFRLNTLNEDANGDRLGTEGTWQIQNANGSGTLRVSLNYLPTTKEGTCDAGFRIFEGSLNYQNY